MTATTVAIPAWSSAGVLPPIRPNAPGHGTDRSPFDQKHVKATYAMDAYFVALGQPTDQWQVRNIAYWYSLWSHRRNGIWKGFVQVDLDPSQDGDTREMFNLAGGFQHE